MNRIVVGLIDTPSARAALRWSAWQAAATGSLIEVVTCVPPLPFYVWSDLLMMSAPVFVSVECQREEAEALQQRVLRQEFGPQLGAVPLRSTVVVDRAVSGLSQAAAGSDLLVVGRSQHRRWFALRSIADRCAACFEGPVVAVPTDHRSHDDSARHVPLTLAQLHDAEV